MIRRTLLALCLVLVFALPAALGGTANKPEILDDPQDTLITSENVIPHLEITRGWVQPHDGRFHFNLQVAALDQIPLNAVYVFHYTYLDGTLYFRANWSADGSEFQYFGGTYQGCKYPHCPEYDQDANRNYLYIPGADAQKERIRGKVETGAPGRIAWSYPMDSYTTDRDGLQFKGLFAIAYMRQDDGTLKQMDVASSDGDYTHQTYTPWWHKFTPGPPPALVVGALVAAVALVARRSRHA